MAESPLVEEFPALAGLDPSSLEFAEIHEREFLAKYPDTSPRVRAHMRANVDALAHRDAAAMLEPGQREQWIGELPADPTFTPEDQS